MIRIPDAPDAFVCTGDRVSDFLQLFSAGFFEKIGLLENLVLLEVSNADGLFAAINVVAFDDGVFVRAR